MSSMDLFRAEARSRDLPEDEVERWLDTVRPCGMLDPDRKAPEWPVVGRIGGLPPLPEGEPVPELPFLAAIDLAAIPQGLTDLPLPKDGTLLFFADTEDPWGEDDWHRLVYVPAGTPVSERAPDGEWPPEVHPASDLYLRVAPSLPNRGSDTEEFPHGMELGSVWWETSGKIQGYSAVQLGGYPWVWNWNPVTDHDHGPGDWLLLAEIGGEPLIEGDLGVAYWIIRREDLAAARFSEARAAYDMT
ncbi:YwqG family protein [Streptomyces sp. NPDC047072]|uniref:YwqG family protein n=1 Tax=Streptomyces sp. NPDC047072 TaxID=3154809 RepID=UPI00340DF868